MDAFVFDEEDFGKSLRLARLLDAFFGIIATAGVIFLGYEALNGSQVALGRAFTTGFAAWGRMWWTRFLSGCVILFGFLFLIVPGVYLLVRLSFDEPIAVLERISGTAAMRRSFALTNGRFWLAFKLWLAVFGVFILPIIIFVLPLAFLTSFDHWLLDAVTRLACDIVGAFGTITLVTTYSYFRSNGTTA